MSSDDDADVFGCMIGILLLLAFIGAIGFLFKFIYWAWH